MGDYPSLINRIIENIRPQENLMEQTDRVVAAFFDLFDDVPEITVERRDRVCTAAVHVHHDCNKMALYTEKLARPNERFCCSIDEAEEWLAAQ